MLAWSVAILVILAVLVVIVNRRPARRGGGTTGSDLFEGLLPSAITGSTSDPGPRDGWELRWTEVPNLTALDAATRQRSATARTMWWPDAGAEAMPSPVAAPTTEERVAPPVS